MTLIRSKADCIFCDIIAGAPAEQVYQDDRAIAIVPLNPVTLGHVIAIPRLHAVDFTHNWVATVDAMLAAFQVARIYDGDCNLITSKGEAATQTIGHLHVHIVPRRAGDGLKLPWSQ